MIYQKYLRPVLFRTDPEWIHQMGIRMLHCTPVAKTLGNMVGAQGHPVRLWGLTFRNRLGLAAGFDKNAEAIEGMYHLGFGFTEVGTVTARPQPGNPKPRIFRIPEHSALINRLGFPNQGAREIAKRLESHRQSKPFYHFPVGINIGKNKDVPLDQAGANYLECFEILESLGDFFVVNVSSPNTPGLRELQEPRHLDSILQPMVDANKCRSAKPILLKIAPDLTPAQLEELLSCIERLELDGIVATNTTTDHRGMPVDERGGLSGAPLSQMSTGVIRTINKFTGGTLPIIGVGGVMSRDDYLEKLDAGASLVQSYTGFVYQGPLIVRKFLMQE